MSDIPLKKYFTVKAQGSYYLYSCLEKTWVIREMAFKIEREAHFK